MILQASAKPIPNLHPALSFSLPPTPAMHEIKSEKVSV